MSARFQILPTLLLEPYQQAVAAYPLERYLTLQDSELSLEAFSFYTSVSAVFSSKIEGEEIDLDSYVKHKRFGIPFRPDHTQKVDDLYAAYQYAQANPFERDTLLEAHRMLTSHILPAGRGGRVRTSTMVVTTPDGRIEYVATPPHAVQAELDKFFADLSQLHTMDLSPAQVFHYAALLHLVFVKIHPFDDGNGRCARLLEKWFLVQKLGEKAWLIPSERHYYQHHQQYYRNIRALGLEYDSLDYAQALPFLLMLPAALAQPTPGG
ncbi:MAG: Fic family protein [Flavobacteriales bacterium]|jgi:Fic family protein|nr:Fic family protein [Flavobacteriales bacterium]MBK7942345.1 Fic family protein [Flavobacteriales bacterium]MBK8948158.1 Fic family protein [Flavobacteriales bacterium]MBK9699253.1 Fic family protein [Flavobacteriales bacterium]